MEQVWSTPRRGFSARSILMFVLTVFITALLWVTFGSQTTHAAPAPATWKGDTILYDGHQFYANAEAKKDNTLGLKEGTKFYTYAPEASSGSAVVKARVIYFSPGTDPPAAKEATYVKYDYSAQKGYSNQSDKQTIEVTPSGDENNTTNSCSVDGVGWVICPVTTWLAQGMDSLFDFISDTFLKVQPVTVTNTDTNLYVSWNIMRTIANVAFIIVFLMIIYAQLTSTAVSNYGIKKLLPRLIVASILVNLSYFIASLAVDISNILGYSLQEVFVNIRQNTFSITHDSWSDETKGWTALTAAVLGGVGIGAIAFNPAILFMIVPLLIGAALAVLFALLILSVRQAIIIILIIVGPLAFVAYLLPNTEQWFKKWRDLFMNMLIFFPAFSLVFGGSQLASSIIMQNATSMFMIALALAVQVAPLAITPLILKFSGGVLGRIAGLVNNPRKGFLDRSKNWANKRVDAGRQTALGNNKTKNPFRRTMQRMAYSDRKVDQRIEEGKAKSERWMTEKDNGTRSGQRRQLETSIAKLGTEAAHHEMGQAMEEARAGNSNKMQEMLKEGYNPNIVDRVRGHFGADTTDVDDKKERRALRQAAAAGYSDARADKKFQLERDEETGMLARNADGTLKTKSAYAKYIDEVTARAVKLDQHTRVTEMATGIAKNKQLTNYASVVEKNAHIQKEAGGIAGEIGQQGALAAAFKAQASAHSEAVSNANSILSHYNYSDNIVGRIALNDREGANAIGAKIDYKITPMLQEAAIMQIAGGGNAGALLNLMAEIDIKEGDGGTEQDLRQSYAETMLRNSAKPKFAGASIIADWKQGVLPKIDGQVLKGKARLDNYIANTINANKFGSADVLVSQDKEYLIALQRTLEENTGGVEIKRTQLETIQKAIKDAEENPIYSGRIAERKEPIDAIKKELARRINGTKPTAGEARNVEGNPDINPTDDETSDMNQE